MKPMAYWFPNQYHHDPNFIKTYGESNETWKKTNKKLEVSSMSRGG